MIGFRPLDEDLSPDSLDHLDGHGHVDFDYDEIDRRLGYTEPNEPELKIEVELSSEKYAAAIREFLVECVGEYTQFDHVGARFIKLAAPRPERDPQLNKAIAALAEWVLAVSPKGFQNQYARSVDHMVGQRVVALAWLISPAYFGGASLRALAKRMKCSPPIISNLVVAASEHFGGIQNRTACYNPRKSKSATP